MLKQKIIRDTTHKIGGTIHGDTYILCAKCNNEVSTRISYFDPYFKGGSQVHMECLSEQRKNEIN